MNLAAALEQRAASGGWLSAPAFYDPERTWSHQDVHRGGHRAAAVLGAAGVEAGDRVLVASADRIGLIWALLATTRVGAVAVLVNPLLPPADHDFILADCTPKVVVCEAALVERFLPFVETRAVDDLEDAEPGLAAPPLVTAVEVADTAPAYAQYTSGTTGTPRAALHRHRDPWCYHRAMGQAVLGLCPDDVVLSVSKAYFAYGLGNTVFFPLLAGCAAVLDPARPSTERVATLVDRHRVTVLFAVPTFYAALVSQAEATRFGSLRLAISAGETLQPVLYHRFRTWAGCDILDGIGSTEVGQTFISNLDGHSRAGTIGVALPGYEAEVRDDTGDPVPPGGTGTLWVRGDSVMLGYLGRAEQTAAVLQGGWCRTGDRVSVEDGRFVHHGRVDDMEYVGGNKVSPLEVEAVLLGHPAVVEAAVAGIFDADGASRLRGFVVVSAARPWSQELEDELLAMARSRLAPFKVPRSVIGVDSLPRTPTGKLRRHVLRSGWPQPAP